MDVRTIGSQRQPVRQPPARTVAVAAVERSQVIEELTGFFHAEEQNAGPAVRQRPLVQSFDFTSNVILQPGGHTEDRQRSVHHERGVAEHVPAPRALEVAHDVHQHEVFHDLTHRRVRLCRGSEVLEAFVQPQPIRLEDVMEAALFHPSHIDGDSLPAVFSRARERPGRGDGSHRLEERLVIVVDPPARQRLEDRMPEEQFGSVAVDRGAHDVPAGQHGVEGLRVFHRADGAGARDGSRRQVPQRPDIDHDRGNLQQRSLGAGVPVANLGGNAGAVDHDDAADGVPAAWRRNLGRRLGCVARAVAAYDAAELLDALALDEPPQGIAAGVLVAVGHQSPGVGAVKRSICTGRV